MLGATRGNSPQSRFRIVCLCASAVFAALGAGGFVWYLGNDPSDPLYLKVNSLLTYQVRNPSCLFGGLLTLGVFTVFLPLTCHWLGRRPLSGALAALVVALAFTGMSTVPRRTFSVPDKFTRVTTYGFPVEAIWCKVYSGPRWSIISYGALLTDIVAIVILAYGAALAAQYGSKIRRQKRQ